jgi:nicotinamide-nucleotide amidase
MPSQTVIDCSKLIKAKGLTIAFAESATAGRLAFEFSLTEDSGTTLKGGLISYDASVKEQVLEISAGLIAEYTPESAEVTKEMAIRLRDLIQSDLQVAVTGLTTQGGSETVHKPVGTMFVHLLTGQSSVAVHDVFQGSPEEIVMQAVELAAQTIMNELK